MRGLRPAVRILADEIEADARSLPDGRVFWNRGDPHLNTALAMLTLLHAGRRPDLVEGAARYLVSEQRPRDGAWDESYFFGSFTPFYIPWYSRPATSAVCLEALCRYLLNPSPASPRTAR